MINNILIFCIIILFIYLNINLYKIKKNKVEHFANDNYNSILNNIYCINLDRSKNRWNYINNEARKQGLEIKRFEAIDGKNILLKNIKKVCTKKYFNRIKNDKSIYGNIGCYFSHLNLLRKLERENVENALIIEDDIKFVKNFKEKLINNLKYIPDNWDIIYLGITRPCGKRYFKNIFIPKEKKCKLDNGGAFAYIVNRRSIKKLLNYINEKKIDNMIDHTYREYFKHMNVYIMYPFLVNHNYHLESDRKFSKYYNSNYINKSKNIKIFE